jgi:Tfp pilus assembly protein PilF
LTLFNVNFKPIRPPRLVGPGQSVPALLLSVLMILFAAGCATQPAHPGDETALARDPKRNTELARQLDDQALDAIDKQDWATAESLLKKSLDADVMFGPAHNNLGKVYFHRNEFYLAAWEFQYAARLLPYQPEPRNNLGLIFEATGKFDDAVEWYDEAVKMQPDNPEFVGNAARARYRRGDRDAQLKQLLQKLVLIDNRPQWCQWAREHLALLGSAGDSAASQPTDDPPNVGEP